MKAIAKAIRLPLVIAGGFLLGGVAVLYTVNHCRKKRCLEGTGCGPCDAKTPENTPLCKEDPPTEVEADEN